MKLEKTLHELGLNKSKANVYLAALQVGMGSTQDIARQAGLPRTTVHEILQNFLTRGLISMTTKGRTRIYTAEKPSKLKKLLQEKENKLDKILPELNLLYNTEGLRPRVRFYEGAAGVKTIFEDTLTTKSKKLYGILSMEDLYQTPGKKFMDDYVEKRIEADIKLNVVRSQTKEVEEAWSTSKKENRELRYAPAYLVFPMTMYLYDNKVSIIGTKKENFGMMIESKEFYETMKNFFDVMWDLSKQMKMIDK